MKATYLLSMYLGDTYLDVHGDPDQIEDIYIHDTDISVFEMVHALNWVEFKKKFKEAYYV